MRTFTVFAIILSVLKNTYQQETLLESNIKEDADTSILPDIEDEAVREQRSLLKKKLCLGGLFGHIKGHQGFCRQYHDPSYHESGYHSYKGHHGGGGYESGGHYGSGYGYGGSYGSGYDGGYGSGYGGGYGSGYGSGHGYGYGSGYGSGYGRNYYSTSSYGEDGHNKPGLSYSIGGYSKSGTSYPSSGSYNSGYSGSSYNKPTEYNSVYSNGGHNSGYESKPHYSSASYYNDEYSDKRKYGEYSKEGYSGKQDKNEHEKSSFASSFSKTLHKGSKSGYSKHQKEDNSNESSSEEDNDKSSGKFLHKEHGHHKKGDKSSTVVPMSILPVVSQPVIYVPPVVPSVSVMQPTAYGGSNSLYTSPCGSSYQSPEYNTPPCGSASYYMPTHYPPQYLSGTSTYQPVTPTYAPLHPSYPTSSETYFVPNVPYPASITSSPVALSYATAVPANQNSGYSYPYSAPLATHHHPTAQSHAPTYTLTSFDVQTITTPYQPVSGTDVKTYAKSGSSVASANGPPGYVVSALATRPSGKGTSDGKDDNSSASEENTLGDYKKEEKEPKTDNYLT